MYNAGPRLVILLLADPHHLESGEGGQDGAANPHRVLPLRGGDDLDLHGAGGQGGDLLLHAVSDTVEHGGAAGQHGVGVEVLSDVHVALHDAVEGGLVDTGGLHAQVGGLEEGLGTTEALVANGDDLAVRKLVALLQGRGGGKGVHLNLKVQGHKAQLLLDVTHDLTLRCGRDRSTGLPSRPFPGWRTLSILVGCL